MKILITVIITLVAVALLALLVFLLYNSNQNRPYVTYNDLCAEGVLSLTPSDDDEEEDDLEFGSQAWLEDFAELRQEAQKTLENLEGVEPPEPLEEFHLAYTTMIENSLEVFSDSQVDELLSLMKRLEESPNVDALLELKETLDNLTEDMNDLTHKTYTTTVLAEAIPQKVLDKVPDCVSNKDIDWQEEKQEIFDDFLEIYDDKQEFDNQLLELEL